MREKALFLILAFLAGLVVGYIPILASPGPAKPNPGHSWSEMECDSNMCVDVANGKVGIGTTNPGAKLEVSGNIKLSGASPTYKITNLATPTDSSDAATKGYVDTQIAQAGRCYSECYTDCLKTNDPVCEAGWQRVVLAAAGRGCFADGAVERVVHTIDSCFSWRVWKGTVANVEREYIALGSQGILIETWVPCYDLNENKKYDSACIICCR
jgi:hypothetical protein